MVYIIIAIDESTTFLFEIISNLNKKNVPNQVIEVNPSDDSYKKTLKKISEIPQSSLILFLGHGQANQLYGGENQHFEKKSLISWKEMKIFSGQYIFLLACDSALLLKASFRNSSVLKSIGFGGLPTEMSEVKEDKKLSSRDITKDTIEEYKKVLIETVSSSLIHYISSMENENFNGLKDYLCLLINKKINEAVIKKEDFELADLLYQMRNELVVY